MRTHRPLGRPGELPQYPRFRFSEPLGLYFCDGRSCIGGLPYRQRFGWAATFLVSVHEHFVVAVAVFTRIQPV